MSTKTLTSLATKAASHGPVFITGGGGIEERQDRRQGLSINGLVTAIIAEAIGAKRAR